ncbi:MAG: HD domain-containing protein [Lachnospiraceae bacterium]|nr:HD domain-containing protein [Lachnospiraceae bacterium]
MKFVKTEDLKIGMRLAKPIYNNKGVLLYDRNSKLTQQGIESVRNFKLIGIYVLEPAEPLPPLSDEDREFEKFQMVTVFSVEEELKAILERGKNNRIYYLAENIIRSYGRLDHRINFLQNLRSKEDFVYKHSLNVAILCAMIGHNMNLRKEDLTEVVVCAIVHDIGKLNADPQLLVKDDITEEETAELKSAEYHGISIIESTFASSPNVKRVVNQAYKRLDAYHKKEEVDHNAKMVIGAKVLCVAEEYDRMTAINSAGEPQSEFIQIKLMMDNPEYFDPAAVRALLDSINLLSEGTCVELSTGEKALVISPNERDVFRPMVLCFSSNTIIDLAMTALYNDIEIVDIMRTYDNRYKLDENLVNLGGNAFAEEGE